MSARRRGRGHGGAPGNRGPRPDGESANSATGASAEEPIREVEAGSDATATSEPTPSRVPAPERPAVPARRQLRPAGPIPVRTPPAAAAAGAAPVAGASDGVQPDQDNPGQQKAACTLAQMRRFIKSRPYVPVHELRRRFLIEGIEDEVSPVGTTGGMIYVGLPEREAGFLGELIRNGEVGCEMLLDPASPGVIGVYPMRPVARQ